jgi:PAS domain S-box-containing protein
MNITGRKGAEEARREAETRFRTFVDHATDALFVHDESGNILDLNRQACESLGYSREELIGKSPRDFDASCVHGEASMWRIGEQLDSGEFLSFETSHRRKDGTVFPVEVRVRPFWHGAQRFALSLARDITERKRAEEEHRAHLWFLESMDRINRAIQGTNDLERMMSDVLDAVLEVFACDRAWLVYPCDPHAQSWRAIMEHTRPEFPGAFALQTDRPIDTEVGAVFAAARASSSAVRFGQEHGFKLPSQVADRFAIRSQIAMAIHPKGDEPYLFGLHQCSHPRVWTAQEERLFQEIGWRLADALTSLLMFRSLRESKRQLEATQRIARVGWWERDFSTNHVSLSDEVCRTFGVQPVDLPHWHDRWVGLVHPEDRVRTAEAAAAALRGGPRYDVEYRVIRPDGTVRVVHSQGDVTWDNAGRPLRQFGVLQDITELRRTEDNLSEMKERFRVLAESSLTAIYLIQEDCFLYVNPAMARMFGYSVEEVIGRLGPRDLVHPEDRPIVAENVGRRLRGEIDEIRYEFRGLRKDGSVFPVEVHGRRIKHGGKIGVMGTLIDNTERKRAEDELRASEARFRTFVDHATDAFMLHDEDGTIIDVNRQACESLGYSRDELIELTPLDLDPDVTAALLQRYRERLKAGETLTFESRHRRKDGTVFPVEVRVREFQQGGQRLMISLTRDITERKRAEYLTGQVFHSSPDGISIVGRDYRYQRVNPVHERNWGMPAEEIVGKHVADLLGAQAFEQTIKPNLDRCFAGEDVSYSEWFSHSLGRHYLAASYSPLRPNPERVDAALVITRDLTDLMLASEALREVQMELAHANRVATMGQLTASIAHEVNQPIAAAVTNAQAASRWLGADPPNLDEACEALARIVTDGRRAGDVIDRIRAMTKKTPARKERFDLNEAIRDVLALTRSEVLRQSTSVQTQLAADLPSVKGDHVQLQQVILNLIMNAIEAMSGLAEGPRELRISTGRDAAGSVLVTVHDTGLGLDPQNVERVFEAFYTTKPGGMGMGLAICRSIIEAHGGQLWASANEPQGAVFQFTVPAERDETAPVEHAGSRPVV